jgi:hypothetical protein
MRNVARSPTDAAPINTGIPVLFPVIKNAATMPGKTACEMASLIMEVLRTMRNEPANAQAMAVKHPVKMIQKTSIRIPAIIGYKILKIARLSGHST